MVEVVGAKTVIDLLEEFGSGLKIDLCGTDVDVSQIGGQRRKTGIDIIAVSVPLKETMNGEGVTKIVKAWAKVLVVGDAGLWEDLSESLVDRGVAQPSASEIDKEGRVWRPRLPEQALLTVFLQRANGRGGQGDPSVFPEFAFADVEGFRLRMEVFEVESQGLADPDSGGIEESEERSEGGGP